MKKNRIVILALCMALLLDGCVWAKNNTMHTATYFDMFDTVTTIKGTGPDEEFENQAKIAHDKLYYYYKLFDIYHDYPNMVNLKTVNDHGGMRPVKVEKPILDLLLFCREIYEATDGKVNVAMGTVLSQWHDARENGGKNPAVLPDEKSLRAGAEHMDFSRVLIDRERSTVYLRDPRMKLDVGAIAKGWCVQQVASQMPEGMMLSVGGNVCSTGPKDPKGSPWLVGIENPGGGEYLETIALKKGTAVTSGDYQRYFVVNGKKYHHIIDPDTLYPGEYWTSVTVVCEDSAVADALSTALFLLPREQGQQLLDRYGACAMWVNSSGEIFRSPGFENLIS